MREKTIKSVQSLDDRKLDVPGNRGGVSDSWEQWWMFS